MFAYFFDEDHPKMPGIFGPSCASYVIKPLDGKAECHLFVGSLLHQSLVYRLDQLTHTGRKQNDPAWKGGMSSQRMVGNKDHFVTIICDLAETLSGAPPSMSEDELLGVLGRKNLWVVVAAGIDWSHAVMAHSSSSAFEPYIGFVNVDAANPIHSYLFFECLFDGKYLALDALLFLKNDDEFDEIGKEYGAKKYEVIDCDDYSRRVPAFNTRPPVTERGKLSASRAAGPELSHRERVANELMKSSKHTRDFHFSTSNNSDVVEFEADEKKFLFYLLNPDHPDGASKAKFFDEVLDIRKDDWRYLADQLMQGARQADLYRVAVTPWQYGHGAVVRVTGRNGRQALVETGWKLQDNGPASLVTAYPYDKADRPEILPVASRVASRELSGNALYEAIYQLALVEGTSAADTAIPTPMVLEKWGTIWEGKCGFGWIDLPSGRTPFSKWLSRNDIGYSKRPGRRVLSPLPTQSIDKHRAFAKGFAGVLLANGIDCSVGSRLD